MAPTKRTLHRRQEGDRGAHSQLMCSFASLVISIVKSTSRRTDTRVILIQNMNEIKRFEICSHYEHSSLDNRAQESPPGSRKYSHLVVLIFGLFRFHLITPIIITLATNPFFGQAMPDQTRQSCRSTTTGITITIIIMIHISVAVLPRSNGSVTENTNAADTIVNFGRVTSFAMKTYGPTGTKHSDCRIRRSVAIFPKYKRWCCCCLLCCWCCCLLLGLLLFWAI